jgi:hypothetical protein
VYVPFFLDKEIMNCGWWDIIYVVSCLTQLVLETFSAAQILFPLAVSS